MKKLFAFILLISFFLVLETSAQTWVQQNSGFTGALLDVCFVNQDTGYASGASGKILKTVNGGNTWVSLNSGTNDALACIQFLNENVGYASGGFIGGSSMNCTLIKTINGGDTWTNIIVAPQKCGGGIFEVLQ